MSAPQDPKHVAGILAFVCFVFALSYCAAGCTPTLEELQRDTKSTADKLSACRDEARAAFFIDGKTEADALTIYAQCKKRGGL